MNTSTNLTHRATALAAASKAILPLAMAASASAATLSFDFFGSGLYSNSGFFASTLTSLPAGGGGITQGTGFKLWGSDSMNDSEFYYTPPYGSTYPLGDVHGMALLWGGTISGSLAEGDVLSAPFDFTYAYTHHPAYEGEYVSASWKLTLGFVSEPSLNWANGISEGAGYASYTSGYSDIADSFHETGTLNHTIQSWMLDDSNPPTHWYVRLEVLIPHENAYGDNEPYDKANNDILTVSVPQNSIDLAYAPIPEPSSLLLSAFGGLMWIRRRRKS